MGCELSRQLKSPARGCGRSIAGGERLLVLRASMGMGSNVSISGRVWLSQPLACEPRVRSCFGRSLATPSPSSDLLLLLFLLFMHQLDHAAIFFIVVKGLSHS